MTICGRRYVYCRQSTSIIVGLCLGIALSLIITPFLDECFLPRFSIHLTERIRARGQLGAATNSATSEDFEPNLRNKPQRHQKESKKLIRPRYYSAELGIKEKLFVGVFSTKETVFTYGVSFNQTVSHHVNKVVFFVNELDDNQKVRLKGMTVVSIADDRPLLRPFLVLSHIREHHANYDFYFLVTDKTYVRGLKLKEFTERISVSERVHLGQKTDDVTVYCSIETGLLLSRLLMQSIFVQLNWCAKNSFSDGMDDNIGRCILHATNVPCSEQYKATKYVSYEVEKNSNVEDNLNNLLRNEHFQGTLTVTALPSPQTMYFFHHAFSRVELQAANKMISELQKNIRNMSRLEPDKGSSLTWPLGCPSAFKVTDRFDVIRWDYFTMNQLYVDNDFSNVREVVGVDAKDINDVTNSTLTYVRQKYDKRFEYRRLLNGYRRFDPTRGMEYVLDLAFRDTQTGLEVHKRMEALRALGKVEIIPIPYVTENTRITMVLMVNLQNRLRVPLFLEDYAKVCLENQDNTVLTLVFIYDPRSPGKGEKNDIFAQLKSLVSSYASKYRSRGAKLSWISIKSSGITPSELGILDLIVRKFSLETLFHICKPDMEIKAEYLNRVRMNTIRGWQVYSPIPFVQYHPGIVYVQKPPPATIEVNKIYGHFDMHSYEHMSFYGADYMAGRKVIEAELPLIRLDKDLRSEKHRHPRYGLYRMFVLMGNIHILRAPEPALLERYILRTCEPTKNEESYRSCLYSRAEGLASRAQLGALVLEHLNQRTNSKKMEEATHPSKS